MTMITIDGSLGEGGGQVLRTAIGLSLVTGEKCVVENVRAGRKKPGLQRQHLTAVLAAAEVGGARVEGAELGSARVAFAPKAVRTGDYEFAIGTAGSTTLVLQTLLPALLSASGPSNVSLQGGTHNPMAPPYDFLAETFAPVLHRMGAGLQLELVRHGFYPAGGGHVRAQVAPAVWTPLELLTRCAEPVVRARIVVARIPPRVAPREASTLRSRLGLRNDEIVIDEVDSAGPGNVVILHVHLGEVTEVVTALGERGVLAETVATRAALEVRQLLAANVPVGEHLADQLLIPMALAGGGVFRTVVPSRHTRTNAAVIERFLPVAITFREDGGDGAWLVEVRGR